MVGLASPDLDLSGYVWQGHDIKDATSSAQGFLSNFLRGKGVEPEIRVLDSEPMSRYDVWQKPHPEGGGERKEVAL